MRFAPILAALAASLSLPLLSAADKSFAEVTAEANKAVADAKQELAQQRVAQLKAKREYSRQITELEEEMLALRADEAASEEAATAARSANEAIEQSVATRLTDFQYQRSSIRSYAQRFEASLADPEYAVRKENLDAVETLLDDGTAAPAAQLEAQLGILSASIDRLRDILGGARVPGVALAGPDQEVSGTYILVGPVSYFAGENGASGIAVEQVNLAHPAIFNKDFREEWFPALAQVAAGETAALPFDATNRDAIAVINAKDGFVEHIVAGGVTMVPLLGLFLVAVFIAIFKIFELRTVKVPDQTKLNNLLERLRNGDRNEALSVAKSVPGPFGDLLVTGVENSDQPMEVLEESLYDRLLTAQPRLERFISFIALTAAAAPLLGLLGTVTGMIQTFKAITVHGTGDPATLSDGISVALITTEYGLIVAVPCLVVQMLLSRAAKSKLAKMERAAVALANVARLTR